MSKFETNNIIHNYRFFTGNSNPELAQKIVKQLKVSMSKAKVAQFSDGEINIAVQENVRGTQAIIIQSLCSPINDNLMELMLLTDALIRASVKEVYVVIPYFGYARQDRRVRSARVPISAKLVANLLTQAGIKKVLALDLHAEQIQGFFDIPVDNIYTGNFLMNAFLKANSNINKEDLVIISPDIGGVQRARAIAKKFDLNLAIIDKRREKANQVEIINIIGSVENKYCVVIDDIIDTAGTLCQGASLLKERGASKVSACITHPVLSGPAIDRINQSQLEYLYVSNSIPLRNESKESKKIQQIDVSNLIAEATNLIIQGKSILERFH